MIIKKCPFCGGEAIALQVGKTSDGNQYKVICPYNEGGVYGCGSSSGYYDELIDAINLWNRRVDND